MEQQNSSNYKYSTGSGSRKQKVEDCCEILDPGIREGVNVVLCCDTMWICKQTPMFQRNIMSPSLAPKMDTELFS
jgi:hypothetical protein